jgi:hypothetical protein
MATVGQLVVELIAQDKNLQKGLVAAVQAAKNAQTKISEISLSPDVDLGQLEAKLRNGTATIADFAGASKEELEEFKRGVQEGVTQASRELSSSAELGAKAIRNISAATQPADNALNQHGVVIEGTRQKYRQFFYDQRLQDRALNEARGAVSTLSGLYLLLGQNTTASSDSVIVLNGAIAQGIQTASGLEFVLFSLGQSAEKLPSSLSTIATSIAGLAGPISLAVGAGALLLTFFQQSGQEASKAIEAGLRDFNDEVGKLSRPQQARLFADVDTELNQVKDSLQTLINQRSRLSASRPELNIEGATPEQLAQIDQSIEKLERRRDVLEKEHETLKAIVETSEAIDFANQLSQKSLEKNTSETQTRERQIKSLRKEIDALLSDENKSQSVNEQIRQKKEQLVRLEREQRQALQTSLEAEQEKTAQLQKQVELGFATRQSLIEQLQSQKQTAEKQGDVNASLEAQLAIEQQLRSQREDSLAIVELKVRLGILATSALEKELNAQLATAKSLKEKLSIKERLLELSQQERDAELDLQSARVGLIKEPNERKRQEEELRFEKEIAAIRQRTDFTPEQKNEAIRIAEVEHENNLLEIRRARTEEVSRLRIQLIEDEHQRKLAALDAELARELGNLELVNPANESAFEEARLTFDLKRKNIERARAEENLRRLAEIEDIQQETRLLEIGNQYDFEEAQLTARYNRERQQIIDVGGDKELQEAKLGNLRIRYETELAQLVERRTQSELNSLVQFGSILSSIGQKFGNDLLLKLGQALQIAIQISKALKSSSGKTDSLDVIGSFLSLLSFFSEGGPVGSLPRGSYVVNARSAQRYEPLLDAFGAATVKGGVEGKDSVPFQIEGGGVALLTPGEKIVEPDFAVIAKAINENKSIADILPGNKKFQRGGSIGGELLSVVAPFLDLGLDGRVELPVQSLRVNYELLASELRAMRSEIESLRADTIEAFGKPVEAAVDIDNGTMFLRKHIYDAVEYLKESQS